MSLHDASFMHEQSQKSAKSSFSFGSEWGFFSEIHTITHRSCGAFLSSVEVGPHSWYDLGGLGIQAAHAQAGGNTRRLP